MCYWLKSNQSFENISCTQFTIVHIIHSKSVTWHRLAPCIIPRLISHRKIQVTKCLGRWYYTIFFAYIPNRINYLRVGRIKFIYITIYVMHYTCLKQLFLKRMSKNQIVYWHLYAYADGDTSLVLAFKLILVYFQHTFIVKLNQTVRTFDHLLN